MARLSVVASNLFNCCREMLLASEPGWVIPPECRVVHAVAPLWVVLVLRSQVRRERHRRLPVVLQDRCSVHLGSVGGGRGVTVRPFEFGSAFMSCGFEPKGHVA